MVSGIGTPIVDYQLAVQGQSQLLTQFQRSPSYKQATDYYQANIGNVKTPDDLLKNRRLLQVALSAFQLEGSINDTGILRKLLTEDPTQKTSLAQRLLDPRYVGFAQAFSSLKSDGGASISSPSGINAVLAGYQTNEYEKFVANTDGDSTVRQALYFKRQVTDVVDISNVGSLFTQYQNSTQVTADVSYYKANIGNVNTPADLLKDSKLLKVALTAYGIDPSQESQATINTLVTQDPSQPTSLAAQDPRYYQFAKAFSTLRTGSGATVQNTSLVTAIVTAYQKNSFENALASNNSTANLQQFGSNGSKEITSILAGIQRKSGITQAAAYYQANIGNVRTVDDLVNNPKLLNVALGGFQIDPSSISTASVRQLLTQDPTSASSLAQQDPRYLQFAQAFASLNKGFGTPFSSGTAVAAVTTGFQTQQIKARLGSELSQAQANSSATTALSIYQILSDPTLKAVVQGALGLPASTGGLPVTQQIQSMTNAGFNVSQLQSPDKVDSLINRFLANAGLNGAGATVSPTGAGGLALALFQNSGNNGDGTTNIDFSFLLNAGKVNLTA